MYHHQFDELKKSETITVIILVRDTDIDITDQHGGLDWSRD